MADSTFVGTPASAASTARWTVTTLKTHFQGLLVRDPAASGGTVPDRLNKTIRESGQWLWNKADWRFRWKQGTLTTVAATGTADLPSDFHKLADRWLRDPQLQANYRVRFFENPSQWQRQADLWDRDDRTNDSEPRYGCVAQDQDEGTFTYYVLLSPVPDDVYTYPFWYLRHDPWTLGVTADGAVPAWPKEFDEGWFLYAQYKVFQAYSKSDVWKEYKKDFRDWLSDHIKENEETLVTAVPPLEDAYGDLTTTSSSELNLDVNRKVRWGW